jgi:hypothetical protein
MLLFLAMSELVSETPPRGIVTNQQGSIQNRFNQRITNLTMLENHYNNNYDDIQTCRSIVTDLIVQQREHFSDKPIAENDLTLKPMYDRVRNETLTIKRMVRLTIKDLSSSTITSRN